MALILEKRNPVINSLNAQKVITHSIPLKEQDYAEEFMNNKVKNTSGQMVKTDDFTNLDEFDIIKNPSTKTSIDRYLFASSYCKDKWVLDCAMGSGFGSALLKLFGAKNVTAIDKNPNAIFQAKSRFNNRGLRFLNLDLFDIPKYKDGNLTLKGMFEVVVSLETMEHLPFERVDEYLDILKECCIKGGKILISCPRRFTKEFIYDGGTHLYEYSYEELEFLIGNHFKEYSMRGLSEFAVEGSYTEHTALLEELDLDKTRVFFIEITNI